jgi:hypothetical protein
MVGATAGEVEGSVVQVEAEGVVVQADTLVMVVSAPLGQQPAQPQAQAAAVAAAVGVELLIQQAPVVVLVF